jgi:hypothetical protein
MKAAIVEVMKPDELDASGTRSLSPLQLKALDDRFRAYLAAASIASQGAQQTYETRIDGAARWRRPC